ncbi:efflux RND transporter permease subunit [bacterium]
MLSKLIRFCLDNKLIVGILVVFIIVWGIVVAPFDWKLPNLPRDPVPVDAIPDIGENQQIVFTQWMGRSPQDIEDQITYPLTTALLGIPGVKTIRSHSFFGFSSIYIIFKEDIDFYWSRSRILEKLSSLPKGALPDGPKPTLGPDATALGQVFWYTIEGVDEKGKPTGGWDLDELRSTQDWYVKYALQSVDGVSEVASVGGFVKQYQIDVDPDIMKLYDITLSDIFKAVKDSNLDIGAKTIEINKVEYMIRGLGFVKSISDIETIVVKEKNNIPISIKDIAHVSEGPALRRGALDKEGSEVVGGVVVARYGENPLATIDKLKEKIKEITPGLPQKKLPDGRISKLNIIPFYDRTGLIHETLGTLNSALYQQILVTIIVVILFLMHITSSLLISGLLPLAILMCFIFMKIFHVDANIVALSGIAIAIGTLVDMGIVVCENILKHLQNKKPAEKKTDVIYKATKEVAGAVLTAVATTIISFLPVFAMTGPEGKLFKPLAFTKTFALFSAVIIAIAVIPVAADLFLGGVRKQFRIKKIIINALLLFGIFIGFKISFILGSAFLLFFIIHIGRPYLPTYWQGKIPMILNYLIVFFIALFLTTDWLPLGVEKGTVLNFIFVCGVIGILLYAFHLLQINYAKMLQWCLNNKTKFLVLPLIMTLFGILIWKNLGKEFMPSLDEGAFLLMPTTMPHASIGEALDVLQIQDKAISNIPEVESVVGKIGRVESSLDPAPISMVETIINYKSEYKLNKRGKRARFKYDTKKKEFVYNNRGELISDKHGKPIRQWRKHIKNSDDIWKEIIKASSLPGTTSAPKLQPIAARIVMLQSGMRAPMGVKIKGNDLKTIEQVGLEIEKYLKEVQTVNRAAVIADRIVGKPYLEIRIDRKKIARYGVTIKNVQDIIDVAIGGKTVTTTVEGRERYSIQLRYKRELRDSIESINKILISNKKGQHIPLVELADIEYARGPQVIKSEDTFLVGYVLFDMKEGYAELDVVRDCQKYLQSKIDSGEFVLPKGTSYVFAGNYENQVRSAKKLALVLPLALVLIFLILYLQFKSTLTTFMVFSGIVVAWAGGFIMLWLYGQGWFLNISFFGVNLRDLFNIHTINLSVAIWVGFLALFGIATDVGVIIATYLANSFKKHKILSKEHIHKLVIEAGERRIRPCLMTIGTTILALLPILTSTGKGSDIMVTMAIPSFGGMVLVILTMFIVPVLYSISQEIKIK